MTTMKMRRRLVAVGLLLFLLANLYLINKRFFSPATDRLPSTDFGKLLQDNSFRNQQQALSPQVNRASGSETKNQNKDNIPPVTKENDKKDSRVPKIQPKNGKSYPQNDQEKHRLKTFIIPDDKKKLNFTIYEEYTPMLTHKEITFSSYKEALQALAINNVIYIALLDHGFVDMAVNLWETSIAPLQIKNFLFVCSTKSAFDALHTFGIPAYLYVDKSKWGGIASPYGSSSFKEKTHMKSKLVLEALEFGFNVILTDPDIIYFKDPIKHFPCADCDLQIQTDSVMVNSGFYLIRNTSASKTLQKRVYETGMNSKGGLTNQGAFERVLNQMKKEKSIKHIVLDKDIFPNGKVYWEDGHRMLPGDNPTDKPVILHNNWMQSMPPKIYRFQEFGMWLVDVDGYYSNPNRKYLVYDNVHDFGPKAKEKELYALKGALSIGRLLNRTVILPIFHCQCSRVRKTQGPCLLLNMYRIETFDKYFLGQYREHFFLKHPKVPQSVKSSLSEVMLIDTDVAKDVKGDELKRFTPKDTSNGATSEEILQWFKPYNDVSVLRFHSLFDAVSLPLYAPQSDFDKTLNSAFKKAEYRQY